MSEIEPILMTIRVDAPPERAFEVFTARMDTWWPLETHSRAADQLEGVKAERIEFEERVGGRVLEHLSDGRVLPWGEVLVWEPPSRLVLAWKPNDTPHPPTELEVRFSSDGAGTSVELEHRGWERLGELAAEARQGYGGGWVRVLSRFPDVVGATAA